jgi:hypothetical protein
MIHCEFLLPVTLTSFQGLTFKQPRIKMLKQVQHDMSWAL